MSVDVSGNVPYGSGTVVAGTGLMMDDAPPHGSVLIANVSGSARLHEKLGGAEAMRAVDRCLKRMERAIEGFGGRIVKSAGDEIMAQFDLADQAFQAAIEIQQRVADLPPVSGVKLVIRVGFSHGSISEEDGAAAGETVSVAAQLAGLAKPGQILTSEPARESLSPALQKSTRDLGSALPGDQFLGMKVFEVIAPDSFALAVAIPKGSDEARAHGLQEGRLRLRYASKRIMLDDDKQVIHMGRDAESDVVIVDRRASRNHAMIVRRGDKIVLIDKSTNGTYVTLIGKPELFLRREECVLHGKGVICFAASANSPDADCAEFEQP